jgi:hypothetical protein
MWVRHAKRSWSTPRNARYHRDKCFTSLPIHYAASVMLPQNQLCHRHIAHDLPRIKNGIFQANQDQMTFGQALVFARPTVLSN